MADSSYLPAAGHDWLLPLYDPLVKLLGFDGARRALVEQASLVPNARVLDLGCGTGTLIVQIARSHPGLKLTGVDPDPKALERAARKARRANVPAQFDRGFAARLPYPDASFDRVLSSFVLHHLELDDKKQAFGEAFRVLASGGSLHVLDFVMPERGDGRDERLLRWTHSHARLNDNTERRILELLSEAGFSDARTVGRGTLLFGRIAYYAALKP